MLSIHRTMNTVIIFRSSIRMNLKLKTQIILQNLSDNLDLHLELNNCGKLQTKRYENLDDFNSSIVNFPFIDSQNSSSTSIWRIHLPAHTLFEEHVSNTSIFQIKMGCLQKTLKHYMLLFD